MRKVFKYGIKSDDITGDLKIYINNKFNKHKNANLMYVYKGHLFIFNNTIFITAYRLSMYILKKYKEDKKKLNIKEDTHE
jgi:hypothetical protein